MNEFIELDRTFQELQTSGKEDDEACISKIFGVGDDLRWPQIIKKHRVIILSEAGSGKTAELLHVTRTLREQGKPFFFVRIEHIPRHFEDAFEVGTYEEFQDWLSSGEEGWLLLDSVDEARLREPGDFELSIRKIGRLISIAKDRTHIVITGRTTAWRPKTDLDLCAFHLPYTMPVKSECVRQTDQGPDGSYRTKTQTKGQEQSVFIC